MPVPPITPAKLSPALAFVSESAFAPSATRPEPVRREIATAPDDAEISSVPRSFTIDELAMLPAPDSASVPPESIDVAPLYVFAPLSVTMLSLLTSTLPAPEIVPVTLSVVPPKFTCDALSSSWIAPSVAPLAVLLMVALTPAPSSTAPLMIECAPTVSEFVPPVNWMALACTPPETPPEMVPSLSISSDEPTMPAPLLALVTATGNGKMMPMLPPAPPAPP
nr:hypothetical protein [Paraburkholderia tropica]